MEDTMGSEGELGAGYMLVPWASWDQWNFVRESLFSSSVDSIAAALRRITAWRSRGCLPVAIQVTSAIIEIRQKDPFFSQGLAGETLDSEDMLAMLYSMAIMRLVNAFVEKVNGFDKYAHKHSPKKKKHSISDLANTIGIPRMVIDIRHESSHRDLPSLPLLRLASSKALDWLKSHYWEPQRKMIPDVRKEVRCRLRQMAHYIRAKYAHNQSSTKGRRAKQSVLLQVCSKLSSQITGKLLSSKHDGFQKQISKTSKTVARLYSVYPMEVVSALLEIYKSQTCSTSPIIEVECSDDSNLENSQPLEASLNDFKAIVVKLSSKKPGLLLTMLKEVLGMIEAEEALRFRAGAFCFKSSEKQADMCQIEHLSSVVPWLLMNLKKLKDSDQIGLIDEPQVLSPCSNTIPRASLTELLRKCLLLSASGNKHISDSAVFLSEMIIDNSLKERLKKLPSLNLEDLNFTAKESSSQCMEFNLVQEEDYLNRAAEDLAMLRSCLKENDLKVQAAQDGNPGTKKMWTLAKSWTTCPIGMLPCPFSSAAFLPVLDKDPERCESKGETIDESEGLKELVSRKREASSGPLLENPSYTKRSREMPRTVGVDSGYALQASPVEGRLLIDGIWRKVGEEELLAIESNVRILVK